MILFFLGAVSGSERDEIGFVSVKQNKTKRKGNEIEGLLFVSKKKEKKKGRDLNGMEWNGMEWNGMEAKGRGTGKEKEHYLMRVGKPPAALFELAALKVLARVLARRDQSMA